MPDKYGLIGYPLSHSFSPAYFSKKFEREGIDAVYDLYPLANISELTSLLSHHPDLKGLNVTIPYKEAVVPYLNEIDSVARNVGAVNCIAIHNGKLNGYNTDVIGFKKSLQPLLKPHHNRALILGTGGAANAVIYVLAELGIDYTLVSRERKGDNISYNDVLPEVIDVHKLIINTTPLGMYPNIAEFPSIPYGSIGTRHLLYDLIYNPEDTQFLFNGKMHGAITKNGLEMLRIQAEASWDMWNS